MLQLHADDWMPHLFQSLWNIFVELHTEPLTNLLSDSLTKIAEELGDWVSMKFPLIIDEAQVLLNPDQVYASATNDSIRPSLLSMMFRAFKEFPRLRIFACGTKEIDETGGPSRLFKYRQDLIVQNGFDLDGVHHFLYRFPIACRPEPTELRWLVGRSRILCSFLERYIRTGNSSVKKFREEFTHSRVKGTIGYELQRRENPKLKTVKGVNIMKLIERCVIYYHLTGLPRPLRTEKHLSLFEIGAARLQRTDWRLEVKIEEPLIVAGALAYFLAEESPMSRQYELMADMRSNPSSLGTLWEQIVPSRLEGILKNARFDNGVPSRNWNILDPASANADPNVLIQISDPVDGPFLPDFLAQPNVKYFIPDICVGPDIVCFASPHENSNDVYMVLVQVKLRNELRRQESQDAMGTTNIRKTCYSRKTNKALVGEAYEESRQRVETAINAMNLKGILRLLVAYPANSHLHLANPNEIRKSERLPASISEDLGENEWLRILDGENA
ncbi:hypothetical protein BZG36_05333 [Bifiguratus adelaidae]|uniref:Uncharacterized protein n=1 Tax=Bifiguratus adelaidae TaxID=1938954 RepID=A0A261XU15_9FUNG|nr:hypothetical protein BZG36_05333 [Bifiguratus adelaidae]